MAALQMDTLSLFARDLVPILIARIERLVPDAATATALELLLDWDGDMAADRPEPVIFAAWIAALHDRLLGDDLGPLLPQYRRIRAATLIRILTAEPHWCDDRQTPPEETCRDLVAGSLSEALAETTRKLGPDIAGWRWGEAHQAVFEHRIWHRIGRKSGVVGKKVAGRVGPGGGRII